MKILLVEDDVASAKLLARHLRLLGHDVRLAVDGEEGWAILEQEEYGLVLTDWIMPKMDGLELVRKIRSSDFGRYVYVMMLTSRDSNRDRVRAIELGVDDFLTKPCDPTELRVRLQPAIRILHMQDEIARRNSDLKKSRDEVVQANFNLKKRESLLLEANSMAEWARNRFSQLFDGLPVAAFTFDSSGSVFETNDRASTLFNIAPHEAFGQKYWNLLGEQFIGDEERDAMDQIFEGDRFEDQSWDDGDNYYLVSGYPLIGQDDEISGAIATVVDVTAQRRAEQKIEQQRSDLLVLNRKLKAMSVTDVLTGVPNHRAFQETLTEFAHRHDQGVPFTLVMVDVDHFKAFNDTHGHQAGDEVLRLVAQCLSDSVRHSDFVARYGGEEFCILFANQEEEMAATLADRVRKQVANLESPYEPITISLGVASFSDVYSDPEALIRDADIAMYQAKTQGRNQVVRASECANTILNGGADRRAS